MTEYVNLRELVAFSDDEQLSEKYVRFLLKVSGKFRYRHSEIVQLNDLVKNIPRTVRLFNCLYGSRIPYIDKEMDILFIGRERVVNIELKALCPGKGKVLDQLISNNHYLKLLRRNVIQYTYIHDTNTIVRYDPSSNTLKRVDFTDLYSNLKDLNPIRLNLDDVFSPEKFLVSPLTSPERFLEESYF